MQQLQQKLFIGLSTFLFLSSSAFSLSNNIIWRSTYYDAVPNKKGVTSLYCKQHSPGTFVGSINKELKEGATTNLGIKMSHMTYDIEKKHGIYFMRGTVFASGKTDQNTWKDHISYYIYKLNEHGTTRGAWSSDTCKGLYIGEPLNVKV